MRSIMQGLKGIRGRPAHRFMGTRAASDNVTHGTWIVVAGALGTVIVGSLAIPGSPVHAWLHSEIKQIACIGASHQSCTANPAPVALGTASLTGSPSLADPWGFTAVNAHAGNTLQTSWALTTVSANAGNTLQAPWVLTVTS